MPMQLHTHIHTSQQYPANTRLPTNNSPRCEWMEIELSIELNFSSVLMQANLIAIACTDWIEWHDRLCIYRINACSEFQEW